MPSSHFAMSVVVIVFACKLTPYMMDTGKRVITS